jgi:stearoyl-CoA desaturase (Delta-9 desaturase)
VDAAGDPPETRENVVPTSPIAPLSDQTLEALHNPPIDPEAKDAVERQSAAHLFWLYVFVIVPLLALAVAIPVAWGGFFGWSDLVLMVVFYSITAAGITAGFHRYFTHGSFKARPWLRITLAIAGSLAIEGPVDRWVADHRKHHAFSDKEGDPHSPWRYGESVPALLKGLFYAHLGWLFDVEQTPRAKYAPDLVDDPAISRISRSFGALVLASLLLPALLGGLLTWSWMGMLTALFWAGLIRITLVHHVTWSVNSICHFFGRRRFDIEDQSTNVAWLAVFSFGESWHHNHHAFPRSAYHGLRWWEIDPSGMFISTLSKLGLAWNVVRITPERQLQKTAAAKAPASVQAN